MFARLRRQFMVEERRLPATDRQRLVILAGTLAAVGAGGFLLILTGVVTETGVHSLDAPIEAWFNSIVSARVTTVMIVLAIIFGPIALPVIIAAVVVVWGFVAHHLWRPILLAGGMVTGC